MFDHEYRVLHVKGRDIALSEAGLWTRPYGDGNAEILLRENIECPRVHVAVGQDDLVLCSLHEGNQQFKSIVDLSLKEDLLAWRLVGLHVVEYALEALVG